RAAHPPVKLALHKLIERGDTRREQTCASQRVQQTYVVECAPRAEKITGGGRQHHEHSDARLRQLDISRDAHTRRHRRKARGDRLSRQFNLFDHGSQWSETVAGGRWSVVSKSSFLFLLLTDHRPLTTALNVSSASALRAQARCGLRRRTVRASRSPAWQHRTKNLAS